MAPLATSLLEYKEELYWVYIVTVTHIPLQIWSVILNASENNIMTPCYPFSDNRSWEKKIFLSMLSKQDAAIWLIVLRCKKEKLEEGVKTYLQFILLLDVLQTFFSWSCLAFGCWKCFPHTHLIPCSVHPEHVRCLTCSLLALSGSQQHRQGRQDQH